MVYECLGIVYTSYLSVGLLRLYVPSTTHFFMWILEIQTQDLILAWQVLYPWICLPRQDPASAKQQQRRLMGWSQIFQFLKCSHEIQKSNFIGPAVYICRRDPCKFGIYHSVLKA